MSRDRTHHEPIRTRRMLNVVPPYDAGDSPDQQRGESTEEWRERYSEWKRSALEEQLPADATDAERELAEWLVRGESSVIAVVASWLYRAREEGRAEGVTETLRAEGEGLKSRARQITNDTTTARKALSAAGSGMIRRADRRKG